MIKLSLGNESEIDDYIEKHNLHSFAVTAGDGDPYLIAYTEEEK